MGSETTLDPTDFHCMEREKKVLKTPHSAFHTSHTGLKQYDIRLG